MEQLRRAATITTLLLTSTCATSTEQPTPITPQTTIVTETPPLPLPPTSQETYNPELPALPTIDFNLPRTRYELFTQICDPEPLPHIHAPTRLVRQAIQRIRDERRVLRDTEMSALVLEMMNIKNDESVAHYLNPCNVYRLAWDVANGIQEFKEQHMNGLTKIIIDDGHGLHNKGEHNTTYDVWEQDFTFMMQEYLSMILEERGFDIVKLNYTGPENPERRLTARPRLEQYVNQANEQGDNKTTIYVSPHTNVVPYLGEKNLPPWIYADPYSPARTKKLQEIIAQHTSPRHCENFPASCTQSLRTYIVTAYEGRGNKEP